MEGKGASWKTSAMTQAKHPASKFSQETQGVSGVPRRGGLRAGLLEEEEKPSCPPDGK